MGRGPKPAKSKVGAKPPVTRKSPKNDGARVRALEHRLAEALKDKAQALEQQTATAEILEAISSSPTDTQRVFETIAEAAVRFFRAWGVLVFRYDEGLARLAAVRGGQPGSGEALLERFVPSPPVKGTFLGETILRRTAQQIVDVETDTVFGPALRANARERGWRSGCQVPMLRGSDVLGVIAVSRTEPGPFSTGDIALLQTFADQAVIAIENVRLFNETKEALERQTATSEILRIIASSPTDLQPALHAIVESTCRVCGGYEASIFLRAGSRLHRMALKHGSEAFPPETLSFDIPISSDFVNGRAVLERRVVQVPDLSESDEFPAGRERARLLGYRTTVVVPLLRQGEAIGTLAIRRTVVEPFTDAKLALLQTFADQAVIAIENVRLFTELQEKNQALTQAHAQTTEALERQTATSEILRVISQSPTDIQPVFEAIARSAARLCNAIDGMIYRLDDARLRVVAHHGPIPLSQTVLDEGQLLDAGLVTGRAILERRRIHVEDLASAGEFPLGRDYARRLGYRTTLAVPLLRQGSAIGAMVVRREEIRPFSDSQMELLETFADQAVIAIENVRLFKELEARNRDLTEALDQQTATGEILQTIAQAQTDVQPVFETIVRSAAQLCHAYTTAVFLTDGQVIYLPASYGHVPEALATIEARFPRPLDRDTTSGTVILTHSVVQVPDIEEPSVTEVVRQIGREVGFRSLLSVPMLRQGEAVGAINVTRREPGPFPDAEVALLQTFADQAVIALENVRLFKELEAANRELSAASQHKSEFLANMSHELRTPLNAIIGFSEVLSEKMFGELNEKQEEYSKDIHASGQHLLSLINDILDLSKIEAGRMELELSDFHLPTALDSALTLVRERAGRRSIALHLSVDEQLGQIQADARKVRQVVLNLLSNAIKFTPESGRIEVSATAKDGLVEVSVSDTGVGIAPEDQEAVFEEFRQVGTADKKVEGTGLGLTLCRKFVELHGGKIWVKSQVGTGSTFTFTIPVRVTNAANAE